MSDEVPSPPSLNVQRTRRAGLLPGYLGQDCAKQPPLLLCNKRGSSQYPGSAEVGAGQKHSDQHEDGDRDQEDAARIESSGSRGAGEGQLDPHRDEDGDSHDDEAEEPLHHVADCAGADLGRKCSGSRIVGADCGIDHLADVLLVSDRCRNGETLAHQGESVDRRQTGLVVGDSPGPVRRRSQWGGNSVVRPCHTRFAGVVHAAAVLFDSDDAGGNSLLDGDDVTLPAHSYRKQLPTGDRGTVVSAFRCGGGSHLGSSRRGTALEHRPVK